MNMKLLAAGLAVVLLLGCDPALSTLSIKKKKPKETHVQIQIDKHPLDEIPLMSSLAQGTYIVFPNEEIEISVIPLEPALLYWHLNSLLETVGTETFMLRGSSIKRGARIRIDLIAWSDDNRAGSLSWVFIGGRNPND